MLQIPRQILLLSPTLPLVLSVHMKKVSADHYLPLFFSNHGDKFLLPSPRGADFSETGVLRIFPSGRRKISIRYIKQSGRFSLPRTCVRPKMTLELKSNPQHPSHTIPL